MMPTDRYWVTLPAADLGGAVAERFKRYLDELEARGRLAQYRLARRRYYGGDHAGTASAMSVTHSGEQGEASDLVINHYGSILTALHAMATASRPAFAASARDDSAQSLASVQLVDQLLEYELGAGAEQEAVDAARRMLVFQEAGLGVFWAAEEGDVIGAIPELDAEGRPVVDASGRMQAREIRSGALRTEAFSPYDVARDLGARSTQDCTWQIVRRRVNRWDLASLYPEHEGIILGAPTVDRSDLERTLVPAAATAGLRLTDTIYVLELYAARTPAAPTGRYARVVGDTCIEAGELQYRRLPVSLHAPERTLDEASGSSRTIDLLGPQQAYDAVMSNLMSNNDAFGRGNVLTAEGQDLDVDDLGGGLQQVLYKHVDGAPPPGPMPLPRLSPEDMRFAQQLLADMQQLKAISGVTRGAPEESLKSGAALALVAAQSAQHNSGDQRAYAEMLREWATRVIETYQAFASTERVIEIAGTDEVRTARTFVGSDLDAVLGVDVQIANPLMRTIAGKKELADFYADAGRVPGDAPLSRADHMAFMSTGRLPHLFRSARSEAIAIREEGEALTRGEPVMVLATDHHAAHVREHKALLDGRSRRDLPPQITGYILEHIEQHVALWQQLSSANPALLAATGQQPAPVAAPVAPPASSPSAQGAPEQPSGMGAPLPPGVGDVPVGAQEHMPQLPQLPTNPMTGRQYEPSGPAPQ